MKVIMLILIPVVSLLLISCEKERTEKVTVIKDCRGSYLRFDGKDYLICNREKAEPFSEAGSKWKKFSKDNERIRNIC